MKEEQKCLCDNCVNNGGRIITVNSSLCIKGSDMKNSRITDYEEFMWGSKSGTDEEMNNEEARL